jgi:uncharacterized phage infection (PIP) family protein YhgE
MDFQPMSPDDMQRTMQFLLDHQAKFAVDLDRMTERFDRLSERFEQLVDKTERIADGVIGLTAVVGQLTTAEQQLTSSQLNLTSSQQQLADAQQATNQRVDRLYEVFVQHLRRDHGYTDV